MFDIFYTGKAPGLFTHEMEAPDLAFATKYSKTKFFWFINGYNIYDNFDFQWMPDIWEEHQQHVFPDQWCRNSETYFCNKYCMDEPVINYNQSQIVTRSTWEFAGWAGVTSDMLTDSIDFSWHPDPMDPPYIYHLPTQYQRASGLVYCVKGAESGKFVKPYLVEYEQSRDNWVLPEGIDESTIDFTWRPNSLAQPYIYIFASNRHRASGVEYVVPGADRRTFTNSFQVKFLESKEHWVIPADVNESTIDFTWRPDAFDEPYIYKFPSKWARESGLEYHSPEADKYKYIDDISVCFNAETLPRYYIETTIEDLIAEHVDEIFWALNKEMNYDSFDFSWHPDNSQRDYVHVFGSQWTKHAETFYIDAPSLSAELRYNFVESQTARAASSTHIFYVDKSNSGSTERYEVLSAKCENISKLRFVKDMAATISRASKKCMGSQFWIISSENDYTDFDFSWRQEPWQNYMFHVFGSKEQKWSDTYLVNKNTFDNHFHYCKDIKEMPDLNFVDDQNVQFINVNDIYEIDFGQHNKREMAQHNKREIVPHNTLKTVQHNTLKTTRFVDSYLSVIKRVVAQSTSEYIWLISNICDYSDFNFDWRPDIGEEKYLSVFASGEQEFGDTFLVHVPSFKEQMDKLELLDWFKTVKFIKGISVPRLPYDQVSYTGDDLTNTIKSHRFNSPYALFFPEGQDVSTIDYNPSVWRLKDRAIHTFTESGSIVLAPRDTLQYLDTQCYDYPEIKRQKTQFLAEKPLDIIFISNGETHAQRNWEILQKMTVNVSNRVVHVQGVKGRAEAYKAAAAVSETDWFFTVFAKLEVDPDFDWGWQTDRLQEPKHYIFYARNDTVGINYGHASIIAYNKKLVLANEAKGLDFTLDQEHEVVPLHSGVTYYDGDTVTAWRTSFREAIKLYKNICDGNFVVESQERLDKWCASNGTPEGDANAQGGKDGVAYYKEVDGDFKSLRLSYDWEWLDNRFRQLHGSQ